MKRKQLIKQLEQLHHEDLKTIEKKNNDYADGEDPFQNFRMVEDAGLCTVETGFLVRMSDKMQRAMNLLGNPERQAQVEDETVTDTLSDLRNYAALLQLYLEDQQQEQEDSVPVSFTVAWNSDSIDRQASTTHIEEWRSIINGDHSTDNEDDRIHTARTDNKLSNLQLVAKELEIKEHTEQHDLKLFYQESTVITTLVDEFAQTLRGGVQ